ncbi:hypothetical protein BIV25_28655 [Streptomyces sp. MUSC 14]|nr:hypothetical protein BIV25_28655 [Streptomyces sp. MUSC 14]
MTKPRSSSAGASQAYQAWWGTGVMASACPGAGAALDADGWPVATACTHEGVVKLWVGLVGGGVLRVRVGPRERPGQPVVAMPVTFFQMRNRSVISVR